MAERRRIVTISDTGTVTTVLDVEDVTNYFSERDTFNVIPGAPKPIQAERARRFGGWRKVGETHDNGTIAWTSYVKGTTADLALVNAEALFALLRDPRSDLFFEWRPEAATASTFYEIRGPASMTPAYRWVTFQSNKFWKMTVEIPVAPLARGLPSTITLGTPTLPAQIVLGTAIPGSAPALADVQIRTGAGAGAPPVWAMFAWWKRLATPLGGTGYPVGIIEAESGTALTGFADTGVDATYRGSHGLTVTAAGAGSAQAFYPIDPSVLDVDDFTLSDVDVEVWLRVKLASPLVSPKLAVGLVPVAGSNYGPLNYSAEWGSAGRLLTLPSTGSAFRLTKAGTLSMPIDKANPRAYYVQLIATWAAGSTGAFAIDYLILVPSRSRALSPTSKPLDATFPSFIITNADTAKIIRGADLSGRVGIGGSTLGRDRGLGGSLIELPPGNVDMLMWLSNVVPDDPTVDTQAHQSAFTLTATSQLTVTPRFYLAKGQ
jgi:hypothetical protein